MDEAESDGERRRAQSDGVDERTLEERGQALKERVYAIFTGLAIVLVQLDHVPSAPVATLGLAIGIVGITTAGFVADGIAHLAVHSAFPRRAERHAMLRISSEALLSASLPVLLLGSAWIGLVELQAALRVSAAIYLVTLGLIVLVAVRRTKIAWWRQAIALATLVGLGGIVLALQQLAHSL